MGTINKGHAADHVTLTLSAQDANKLLTALTHAIHKGGLKAQAPRTKGALKPK